MLRNSLLKTSAISEVKVTPLRFEPWNDNKIQSNALCRHSDNCIDIQSTIECGFTLKRNPDMIRTYSQMYYTNKYSQHSWIIGPVWLIGSGLVCGFESYYNHLNAEDLDIVMIMHNLL